VIRNRHSFTSFVDDLDRMLQVGGAGSGVCVDDGFDAYLIHPYVTGGNGKLAMWGSSNQPPTHNGCSPEAEDSWWLLVHDPTVTWTALGTFDYPGNGVVWADGHVILGNRGPNPTGVWGTESVITDPLTILAGTSTSPKNFILNTDTAYLDPNGFDVLGMIGSDEFVINPYAVGPDRTFFLRGALLGQQDRWRISQYCGDSGNYVRFLGDGSLSTSSSDPPAVLNVEGSIATPSTGNVSLSFSPRNYGFDARLAYLRPPFYPLLGDDWSYENWSEDTIPAWAK